jgi:hypothetical protein
MSREAVRALLDRLLTDATFGEEFRADPEGVARRHGVELTEEEAAYVQGLGEIAALLAGLFPGQVDRAT